MAIGKQTRGGSNNEELINNSEEVINNNEEGININEEGINNNEEGANNNEEGINNNEEGINNNEEGPNNNEDAINNNEEGANNNEETINYLTEVLENILNMQDEEIALLQQEHHRKERLIEALKKKKRELEWPIATDGILRWDINDFDQKRKAAIADESQRFVTSDDFFTPEGHRLFAVAYLNGNASFKGKGISLYVAIKKGPRDVNVAWPLPYTNITFEIRSQRNDRHWEKNFPVDEQDLRFHQPTREQNEAVGFEDFIDLAELEIPENHFFEEDKVCVMITVN